ncbi:germ cell-less protein-like 1 [Onychomys torridus]|uniref:germ cell-less protein-like 1 n=1 Tax=Onychomys torridus TaxID=38674 RepID=UPI00167FD18F|nr:germ cell-less protein-like 1 [Onychomys torridus]
MWFGRHAPAEEAPAAGDGEAEEAGAAAGPAAAAAVVVREEPGDEAAGPATSGQVSHKRKAGPGGPQAKVPRRKKGKDQSRSIYESLFLRGEESDVKICAFEEEWCLHRVYLCRSGYFASMFSGAWRETNMTTIEMEMPDKNIDRDSFHQALGYLYSNRVEIPPCRVVAILATASMLQLDGLIRQCEEVMMVSVNIKTVCTYYYCAENYGLQNILYICRQWLLDNLMIQQNDELLPEISLDLMKQLIASSDLLVIGVEIDVYTTLKKWMFLQLEPTWSGPPSALLAAADVCFAKYKSDLDGAPFLQTDQGRAFVPVFQQLRLSYIICDLPSAHVIDQDALIPATWLTPVYKEQWLALLLAEQSRELGPTDVHVSDVRENSMRCGRQICTDEQCSWSWSGFNFGWDLVVEYNNKCIIFRRSALNKSCGLSVSLLWQRKVAFRLRVISLDETGRAVFRKDTDYNVLSLRKSQRLEVVNLENENITFPIYVACNFLYLPGESSSSSNLAIADDPLCKKSFGGRKAHKVREYLGTYEKLLQATKHNRTVTVATYPGSPPINIYIISENTRRMVEGNCHPT